MLWIAPAVAAGSAIMVWFVVVPFPWSLRERDPESTALMEQRAKEAEAAGRPLLIEQRWVGLDAISPNLQRAVVIAEDWRFREHQGVDWLALAEELEWTGDDDFSWLSPPDLRALAAAVRYGWAHRSELRGRSTITQQLAKNLYFGTDRSFFRKALELVVAGRLERRLGKERILELYLNVVEWGPGLFGAEAASRSYFGSPAADLTRAQAAALAATLPHPLTSNPVYRPERMAWRRDLILQRMSPGFVAPTPVPPPDPDLVLQEPAPSLPDTGVTSKGGAPGPGPRY